MKLARATIVAALMATSSCSAGRGDNGQRGGAPEEQLLAATVARDLTRVQQLLGDGADPNKMVRAANGHLESPWRYTVTQWKSDRAAFAGIARAMLSAHANPEVAFGESSSRMSRDTYTVQRTTPLLEAVANDSPDLVRALLETRLDRNSSATALVLAIENGQTSIVHMLVEAGVDVNTTHAATTPLVAAVNRRDVALMTYLEEHGAREKP